MLHFGSDMVRDAVPRRCECRQKQQQRRGGHRKQLVLQKLKFTNALPFITFRG
jgi:hypothetical protein